MSASRQRQFAAVALAAVAFLSVTASGCRKSDANGGRPPPTPEDVPVAYTSLAGTVQCNGEPVTFGYVVFCDLPAAGYREGPAAPAHYQWAEISEDGTYHCDKVPAVNDVGVMVITDPDQLRDRVVHFFQMNKRLGGTGRPPETPSSGRRGGGIVQGSPASPQPRFGSPIKDWDASSTEVAPRPDSSLRSARRGGRGGDGASQVQFPGPNPKLVKEMADMDKSMTEVAERGMQTLESLSPDIKSRLARINEKYGTLAGAVRVTISEGQKELDIDLTVE
jgi:hypothetical protein